MKNKASIIIVHYNTPEILAECINSIYKYENPETFEIIIVDNCSPDKVSGLIIAKLAAQYPFIKIILLDKQVSFSHANNTGFNSTSGDYIVIMNPDIIFTEPVFDKLLNDFQNHHEIGALTPALIGTDGKFQRMYFQRYPTLSQFFLFHSIFAKPFFKSPSLMNKYLENQAIDINRKEIFFVEQIPFAFFMTKREIFKSSGMIDEGYYLFFEDMDLSYTISKTYKLAIDTTVSITHLGGSSFRNENNWNLYGLFIRSMIYYFGKNYGAYKRNLLKFLAVSNSLTILGVEKIKKVFGKQNNYRIKKHKYFLEIVNKEL